MSEVGGARRPYVRSMHGWWRRDPFFKRYMLREATALAVLLYAIVLAVGVWRLAQGETAWNGWLAALRSPWSVLLHVVLLAAMAFHAWRGFQIMPKTLPMLFFHGRRVPPAAITRSGWVAAVCTSLALFALARWWQP